MDVLVFPLRKAAGSGPRIWSACADSFNALGNKVVVNGRHNCASRQALKQDRFPFADRREEEIASLILRTRG